tara:strand:- start:197 stop:337 length:141 start_codon:yes stop_codon:yes gene_type:complete
MAVAARSLSAPIRFPLCEKRINALGKVVAQVAPLNQINICWNRPLS